MAEAALREGDLPQLREILLALLAGSLPPATPRISAEGWAALDRIAALHRLQPLLHHLHRESAAIPAEVRGAWHEAYRAGAMRALVLSGELSHTVALLEQAGLAPIALKGAWLAWHAYPHPALRPMRDLDLLLTPETVVAGFELLLAHGYTRLGPQELSLEDCVRLDKHMPPLLSPRGVAIELHQRLWEIDGRMDHAAPRADETAIRARAIRPAANGPAFLHPADLLPHLIIHAVYDHRLDCGPLVLPDIAFLLRAAPASGPIDWDRFWSTAAAQRWERGAALVLELARAHAPDLAIPLPAHLPALPPAHVPLAASLLLQELETRQSAGVLASLAAAGPRALIRRVFARRREEGGRTVARDLGAEGGFLAWARARLTRTLGQVSRADVRHQSRALARLSRWLDS